MRHFLQRFYISKPIDIFMKAYFHILNFFNFDQFRYLSLRFLFSLNDKQIINIIPQLPNSSVSFFYLMKQLLNSSAFLLSYNQLLSSFNLIPKDLLKFFNYCFRSAMKSNIFSNMADVVIASILDSDQFNIIDFFFSAFITDKQFFASQKNISETFFSLHLVPKCSKLPISYLQFLMLINFQEQFSESQYWSFFIEAPLLTLDFIEKYPIDQLKDIWCKILKNLFLFSKLEANSPLFDAHLNILYCFLQSSHIHSNLLIIFTSNIIQPLLNILFSKTSTTFSDQKWSALLLSLILCRVDNNISQEISKSSLFRECLRKIVQNESNDSKQSFESVKKYFLWVLSPTSEFPLQGLMPSYINNFFVKLPQPSSVFTKEIGPFLVSLLVTKSFSGCLNESEIDDFLSMLEKMIDESENEYLKHCLLFGLSQEEAVVSCVPYLLKNSLHFDLLCKTLSFSCNFTAFSMVYNALFNDHEKFIRVLTYLAKNAPIVNDFARVTSQFLLKINCMEKTVVMWIRVLKQPTRIATFFIGKDTNLSVVYQNSTFVFDVNQKTIKFAKTKSSIDGWHFISISLSRDSITAYINMTQVTITHNFGPSAFLKVGDDESKFDLQSVRIFNSNLSENQIKYLFFLGPNFKELVFDNLSCIRLKEKAFAFATSDGYISSVFAEWATQTKNIKDSIYINFGFEYILSPPFILNEDQFVNEKMNFSNERFHLQSFFNSFEAFGGFSLLIHILAEILLREKNLHKAAFELLFVLLNRFPFVHHYFKRNKLYQIIGQLIMKTSEKVDLKLIIKCAFMNLNENDSDNNNNSSNIVILNSSILKYWLLTPSIYNQNAYEIIERNFADSLRSEYKDYNLNIIISSPIFSCISKSFMNSKSYSNGLFQIIVSLRLQITTKENAKENIKTIIQCLLDIHLSTNINKEEEERNHFIENVDQSSIFLMELLVQIFNKFPESVSNSSIEDLLHLFKYATNNIKVRIFVFLMKYLNPDYYSHLISALAHSNSDRDFIKEVFDISFEFINVTNNMKSNNFHYITIPLLFFINHSDIAEDLLVCFCAGLNGILQNIQTYPGMMMDHMYLSLRLLKENPSMVEKHLEPKFEDSFTRVPQPLLMYITFVQNAVFKANNGANNILGFLIRLSKIDYGQISIFILSSVFNNLNNTIKSKKSDTIGRFVDFCLSYFSFIIQLRKETFESNQEPPPNIQGFIISSVHICDKLKNKSLFQSFAQFLLDIETNFPDFYSTFENDLKRYKSYLKTSKSSSFSPNTLNENFRKFMLSKEKQDMILYQNIFEQSSQFQNQIDQKLLENRESYEGIIKSWKFIFDRLHFPGSLIHKNCPEKYKMDEFSKKYQIHRLLFPINPAYEFFYSERWSEKYSEPQPNVVLTMEDVIFEIDVSHSKNILFSENILYLFGVRAIEGNLTIDEKHLRFFFPSRCDEIIFNLKNIYRIILNEYLHQPSGFSIEDKSGNLYSFTFKTPSIRASFVEKTKKIFIKKKIKIINKYSFNELSQLTNRWENGELSNFEYLINLNFISGRSWADFTRYPFFPWVFSGMNKIEDETQAPNNSSDEVPKEKNTLNSSDETNKDKESLNKLNKSSDETNEALNTGNNSTNETNEDKESLSKLNKSFDEANEPLNSGNNSSEGINIQNNSTDENPQENESLIKSNNSSGSILKERDELNKSSVSIEDDSKPKPKMISSSLAPKNVAVTKASSSPKLHFKANPRRTVSNVPQSKPLHFRSDSILISQSSDAAEVSEMDASTASTASTSEEGKNSGTPLLPFAFRTQLKSARSAPSVPPNSPRTSSFFSTIVSAPLSPTTVPLHFSSTSSSALLTLNKNQSITDYLSDSSYKLDIQQSSQYDQQNDQPTFKITSFNDLYSIVSKSQYQVRNLCLPFFAQTLPQQLSCLKYYRLTDTVEKDPHHYSSYMSNISSSLYFLVRLEPSTTFEIDHQDGKLDAADRTFQSLELTLQVMSNLDSRSAIELTPEFYFMPEVMMNINGINFPRSPIHHRVINDVFLPKWAKNHQQYVRFMRKQLESEKDSTTLNGWIDMVWGVKREGKLAIEKFNTFQKIVFKFNPSEFSDNQKLLNAFKTQIINCGQAPYQLFGFLHTHRKYQPKKRKLNFTQIYDISVEQNSILNEITGLLRFADEIDISIIAHKRNDFVFAHKKVPVISYWNFFTINGPNNDSKSKMKIEFVSLMRGNLSEVKTLDLSENKLVVAGHADGKLSTFCLNNQNNFLRTIDCPLNFSISLVKVIDDNSLIVAFQNYGTNQCLTSLFSSNGFLIEKLELDDHVIDCALSSFFDGIQKNYAFVLTRNGTIMALSMNSLEVKYKYETNRNDITSLYLKDNYILLAVTQSNDTLSWSLF